MRTHITQEKSLVFQTPRFNPQMVRLLRLLVVVAVAAGCNSAPTPGDTATATARYTVEVVQTHPHDTGAFTQGLFWHDGFLYESTGRHGESSLRRVELETGDVVQRHDLDDAYFGEGITELNDRIYQLTWQEGVGFVYDRETFEVQDSFTYEGEGWGLTDDGESLIMSDGSHVLRYLDPETLTVTGTLEVTDGGTPVNQLNDLQYVDGEIYANLFQSDWIVRIDADTGELTGWIDLRGLLGAEHRPYVDVLNGIAHDAEGDRLFVTGKLWPSLFEIRLQPEAR